MQMLHVLRQYLPCCIIVHSKELFSHMEMHARTAEILSAHKAQHEATLFFPLVWGKADSNTIVHGNMQ